jgi:hypothetical protein
MKNKEAKKVITTKRDDVVELRNDRNNTNQTERALMANQRK